MIALTIVACDSGRPDEADHLIIRGTRGTNPDLACRTGFAALAVEVALARHDLPLADRRAATLTDLTSRPGRSPPLLAGWTRIVLAEHLLARHQVDAARALLDEVPDTGYTGPGGRSTLARCLLAQDDPSAALQLLTTFMPACAPYLTVAVDARIVAATAAQRLRRDAQALGLFSSAVDLAADPGITGPFLAAAESIHPMLDRHRTLVARHADFTAALRQAPRRTRNPRPPADPMIGS